MAKTVSNNELGYYSQGLSNLIKKTKQREKESGTKNRDL